MTLHLTLFKRWFNAIASGEKTEEYRLRTAFWDKRLSVKSYDEIQFRNGYAKDAPWMRVECCGITSGEWEGQACYIIKLGKILEIRNQDNSSSDYSSESARGPQTQSAISYAEANGCSQTEHEAGRFLCADIGSADKTESL